MKLYQEYPRSRVKADLGMFVRIGRLFGRYRLKPHDKAVLRAFVDALPDGGRQLLQQQLDYFNHIRHHFSRQVVAFSRLEGIRIFLDAPESVCFGHRTENLFPWITGTLSADAGGARRSVRVDLYPVNGSICEMIYERKFRDVFGSRRPKLRNIEVSDIHVLFDPRDPDPFPCPIVNDIHLLPDWVRPYAAKSEEFCSRAPLEVSARNRIVAHYGLFFPEDYLELVACSDYIKCEGHFEVYGLSEIWIYTTPDEYVMKLAEIQGYGALCLLRNEKPGLYYMDHVDHIPIHVGMSFRDALEKAITDGVQEWNDSLWK